MEASMRQRTLRQRISSQAGMSLVEMLLAVVVLSIGLLGLAELQVTAMKANSQSNVSVAAASLAQRVIETVTAMSADDIIFDNGALNQTWPWSPVTLEGSGAFNVTYSVRRSIDPDDADPNGPGYMGVQDLCRIDVTVTSAAPVAWGFGGVKQHAVTMTTIKRAS
jgi:prepilin-type N-terminal cleavage/methylation domain-containing protein